MIDPKVGEIWVDYSNNDYMFICRVSSLYVFYEVITRGHIGGSWPIDGFKKSFQLYQ